MPALHVDGCWCVCSCCCCCRLVWTLQLVGLVVFSVFWVAILVSLV